MLRTCTINMDCCKHLRNTDLSKIVTSKGACFIPPSSYHLRMTALLLTAALAGGLPAATAS